MKTALVTGGSGEIGTAICLELARQGNHVLVHSNRHPERADEVVSQIRALGHTADAVCFDVSNADATRTQLQALISQQPIQILVNNAGIHKDAPLAGMSSSDWHSVINVSLHGFYNVTHSILLPMIGTRWGRIINMSSVTGIMGNRGQCNYAAAKSALHGATKSLAQEVASRGITVNAIAPGIIAGSMTADSFTSEHIKNIVPMRRSGKPEEVAALTAFLCSDAAAYISGQIIGVNGAMA